jgi:hypothetical protein
MMCRIAIRGAVGHGGKCGTMATQINISPIQEEKEMFNIFENESVIAVVFPEPSNLLERREYERCK